MSDRNSFIESTKETDERLQALMRLYPEIFSDGKINLDAFKNVTGASDLPEGADKTPGYYGLYWPGKRGAKQLARKEAEGTLEPVAGEGVSEDTTHNIYIEGDNLEVLRILKQSYKARVKMIYIDPPYNTGNDFIYPDDYKMPVEEYLKMTGQKDEGGKRLVSNTKSGGAFHTNWLNMMYPRLQLARELLTEDGVIFISIDDNEQANLKLLCDDVFGEENFVGQLILKTATDNNHSQINTEHEYMMCYVKCKIVQSNWVRQSEAAEKIIGQYRLLKNNGGGYIEIQSKLRNWIKLHKDELPQVTHYNNVDEKGVYSSSGNSSNPHPGGYMFDIIHPVTGLPCPKPENGWRWPEKTFLEYAEMGEIEWGKDHTTQPHVKKRIETSVESLRTLIYEDNRATTKMVAEIFGGRKVFDNPKPMNVLKRIIEYVVEKNAIILDFFSGSATTAHAVMQLNAEDGGHRKFIMVQLPHACDENSEAHKAGYKNICEIGKERIRRAGAKILEEAKANKDMFTEDAPLDTGFKVFRLQKSNFVKYTPVHGQDEAAKASLFDALEGSLVPLAPGWKQENVLTEIILRQGFALDCKKERLEGFKENAVWKITDSPDAVSKKITLYVCLDDSISGETIKTLALGDDEKFVCLDSAIDDSSYARLSDKGRIETI